MKALKPRPPQSKMPHFPTAKEAWNTQRTPIPWRKFLIWIRLQLIFGLIVASSVEILVFFENSTILDQFSGSLPALARLSFIYLIVALAAVSIVIHLTRSKGPKTASPWE